MSGQPSTTRFGGIISGTNGIGPHGIARYGDEWRTIEPVDGVLTAPTDADQFFMVAGGGAGDGGADSATGTGGPTP